MSTLGTSRSQGRVAVLGLGAMGLAMAKRLAESMPVHAFDLADDRMTLAAQYGAQIFPSAREAVAGAETVLVAVRSAAQVHQLLFGLAGVAPDLGADAVVILTSTVGRDAIPEMVARLGERGVPMVDAPISGGPVRAAAGDLLIVVGAEAAALDRARPVLDRLASTVSVVGAKPGDGQALKTVNQLLCGVHIAAAAEALALAQALGLDAAATLAALEQGAAASFMLSNRGPRMLLADSADGAEVLSRLDIFVKDMGIVGTASRTLGIPTPVAAAAEQLYLMAQRRGLSHKDDSAIIEMMLPAQHRDAPSDTPSVIPTAAAN